MQITLSYIFSQIFIIIYYVLFIITYQLKNKKAILILTICASIATSLSFVLLSAYTGLSMAIVTIIRNILFFFNEQKYGRTTKITKQEIILLVIVYIVSIVFAIITYDGLFSLTYVFATMLFTYSVWQKNIVLYKILGVPIALLSLVYSIYIFSIIGIIFDIITAISAFIGYKNIKNITDSPSYSPYEGGITGGHV